MSKVAYGAYFYNYEKGTQGGKFGTALYASSALTKVRTVDTTSADPKVFYFTSPDGKKRVLAFETVWENQVAKAGSIQVYNEEMQSNKMKLTTTGLVNLSAITEVVNGKLYAIDYDAAKVVRFSVASDGTLSLDDGVSYTGAATQSSAKVYGVDIITDGTSVYALFVSAVSLFPGDYKGYSIVKLDTDLKSVAQHTELDGLNPFSIQLYKGDIYVVLVGGGQQYGSTNGANSKIQKISTSNFSAAATTLLVGGDSADLGDFRALSFTAAGKAYILTGHLDSAAEHFSGKLYYTTAEALNAAAGGTIASLNITDDNTVAFTAVAGWTWGTFYSEADGVLWTAQGEDIGVYKANVKKEPFGIHKTITIADLAGSGYHLNHVVLLEAGVKMKAYTAPEFASVSNEARLAREQLLSK